jgi:pimeloyl-ACP methyl ester carboxylesterase
MDALNIKKAHFVGLSMGGLICQELTTIAQERMLSMTLADAAGFYPPEMAVEGLQARLDRIQRLPMSEIGAQIAVAATAKDVDADLLEEITKMFQGNRPIPYAQATEATLKADYRTVHADIQTPTLILVGELDPVTPLDFAQYLNAHIRQSVLSIIPKASHMSKLENPVAFNQALSRFIAPFEPQAYKALV